jgi:NAD(P)-dependent dehydrogenase (short-subunit alcohol dehydrogenase family)
MSGRLSGKVCLVTGTGGRMGRATAETFAREGARLVGCDVAVEPARETVEIVRAAGGEMVSLQPCRLSDPAEEWASARLRLPVRVRARERNLMLSGRVRSQDCPAAIERFRTFMLPVAHWRVKVSPAIRQPPAVRLSW